MDFPEWRRPETGGAAFTASWGSPCITTVTRKKALRPFLSPFSVDSRRCQWPGCTSWGARWQWIPDLPVCSLWGWSSEWSCGHTLQHQWVVSTCVHYTHHNHFVTISAISIKKSSLLFADLMYPVLNMKSEFTLNEYLVLLHLLIHFISLPTQPTVLFCWLNNPAWFFFKLYVLNSSESFGGGKNNLNV